MNRYKLKITYEIEVEASEVSMALSTARGRIERPRGQWDAFAPPTLGTVIVQLLEPPQQDQLEPSGDR